ncbi:MAG: Smr/MutS family protein [Deltaproteobacteria bacterium]|nr:Smr/MutS family protein [Deltaproteobacteria bacterium]
MRSKTGKRGQIRRLSAADDLFELFGEQNAEQPGQTAAAGEEPFSRLLEDALAGVDQQEILSRKYPEPDVPDSSKQRMSHAPAPRAELDLHGCHVQEALVRVEAFIETCALQGLGAVRIIVGKGLHSQAGAVLPDAVEKKIVELKRAGRIATFSWEKKSKRASGSIIVFLP